jgi:hypothetical protein
MLVFQNRSQCDFLRKILTILGYIFHFVQQAKIDIVLPYICYTTSRLTACVTCVWAGVDKVWEQEKPEARKMLVNRAESHTSGARFVGGLCARHAD